MRNAARMIDRRGRCSSNSEKFLPPHPQEKYDFSREKTASIKSSADVVGENPFDSITIDSAYYTLSRQLRKFNFNNVEIFPNYDCWQMLSVQRSFVFPT